MEFLAEAVAYEGSAAWRSTSREVPAFALQALYRQSDEVVCLGIKRTPGGREPDKELVGALLSAVDAQLAERGFAGDHGLAPCRIPGFDALGHVSGHERRFARGWSHGPGWSDDVRVVHVFPCLACELSAAWPTPRFAAAMRNFDVFDLARAPQPYIEIRMQGGKSKLRVTSWSRESLSATLTYARILAEEPSGVLEVRNIVGDVIVLNAASGWGGHDERIAAHALLRSGT